MGLASKKIKQLKNRKKYLKIKKVIRTRQNKLEQKPKPETICEGKKILTATLLKKRMLIRKSFSF